MNSATLTAILMLCSTGDPAIGGVASTPAVALVGSDMRVFFGCMEGKVYAVNAQTGALCWQYDTGYKVLSSPVVSNGTLYIGTEHDDLLAINASSGSLVFTTHLNSNTQSTIMGTSSPMVVNLGGYDYVFVGSDDGYAYKVYGVGNPYQGTIAATFPERVGNWPTYGYNPIESSPSYREGIVYFGVSYCEGGPVYGVDATTFAEVWSSSGTAEVRTTPALCAQGIYVGDETGNWIYRFALDSSARKDDWNMLGHVFASQALTSALVYAGSDAGVLQARDLLDFEEGPGNKLGDANGDPLDLGAKIGSSPAVCYTLDGAAWRRWVFITTRDGSLHAFSSRL